MNAVAEKSAKASFATVFMNSSVDTAKGVVVAATFL
jgi:hypothetical protein